MTVGEVVINESVQLDGKLDKVTATQDSIKAYCVDTEGNNILLPYQTPTELPVTLPFIDNFRGGYSSSVLVDLISPLTIPTKGVIFLQKLISDYNTVPSGWQLIIYSSDTPSSFLYYYYTGSLTTCTVTYIGYEASSNRYYIDSVTGTLSNDRIYFYPRALNNRDTDITVVRVVF